MSKGKIFCCFLGILVGIGVVVMGCSQLDALGHEAPVTASLIISLGALSICNFLLKLFENKE